MSALTANQATNLQAARIKDQSTFASASQMTHKSDIAGLSLRDIARMSATELRQVLDSAFLFLCHRNSVQELDVADRQTLEHLVYRARHCCRLQGY
jgi:hypothetical protein